MAPARLISANGLALEQLVAEAIPKVRNERGGEIADLSKVKEALAEMKGIGPATLDQLGDVLKVSRHAAKPAVERPAEAASLAAKASTEEVSRATCEATEAPTRAAETGAEATANIAASGAEVASRTAEETTGVALTVVRGGLEASERATGGLVEAERAAAARSGEAVGELSRLVADLVKEQLRANVEAMQALSRARAWPEVLEAHAAFFRGNVERMTEGSSRYLEAVTRLAAGFAGGGRGKDTRAA